MSGARNLNARQINILKLIESRGVVTLEELMRTFEVTPQTLRRDLTLLAEQTPVQRFHGGASWPNSTENISYQDRQIINLSAKEAIAHELVRHVPNNSSLFINIGTTTEAVARALLNHQNLQIVTNNLHVASILYQKPDFRVIIASGEVRSRDGGIVGEATIDFIEQFRLDYGIIGISAIDEDGSLLDYDYREVRVARTIMKQSREILLAADHSKFGRRAMIKLGNLQDAHHLFTDQPLPSSINRLLQGCPLQVHVCGEAMPNDTESL